MHVADALVDAVLVLDSSETVMLEVVHLLDPEHAPESEEDLELHASHAEEMVDDSQHRAVKQEVVDHSVACNLDVEWHTLGVAIKLFEPHGLSFPALSVGADHCTGHAIVAASILHVANRVFWGDKIFMVVVDMLVPEVRVKYLDVGDGATDLVLGLLVVHELVASGLAERVVESHYEAEKEDL